MEEMNKEERKNSNPFLSIQNLEEVEILRMILPSCNNLGGIPNP